MSVSTTASGADRLRRDAVLVLGVALVLFALSLIPYVAAYLRPPAGQVFNGFIYLYDDVNTYLSKMREGAQGAWGWSDPYISKPVAQPVELFLFYILWGKVAAILHLPLVAGYHLARLSAAIILVAAALALVRACLPAGPSRRYAAVLALTGSGVGFLAVLAGRPSVFGTRLDALDLRLPELSGFYSILAIPHFAWAAALVALSLVFLMETVDAATRSSQGSWLAAASATLVLLCFIHPQMVFVLAALAGTYLLLRHARAPAWLRVGLAFLPSLPLIYYYLRILLGDPIVRQWSTQWRHGPPDFLSLLLALGIPLALALASSPSVIRERNPRRLVLAVWIVLVLALLYLPNPVNIQRRLIDGLYLPLAALGGLTLAEIARARAGASPGARRRSRRLAFALPALATVSSLLILALGAATAGSGKPCRAGEPCFFLSRGEDEAIAWLAQRRGTGLAPAVLSGPDIGLFIPSRSGDRVYIGHYSETISYQEHFTRAVTELRAGGPELQRFMRDQGITYLFYGPRERSLGAAEVASAGLVRAYPDRDGVTIYLLPG